MTVFTQKAIDNIPMLVQDLQITKVQAAGIFGNIGTETGGFSALQERSPKAGKGGYGWFQWTGPRRTKYINWCKLHNYDPASDIANYNYIVFETKGDQAASLLALRKTTTVEAATKSFMQTNLRPGVPNLNSRIGYAKQAFAAVQGDSIAQKKTSTIAVATGGAIATGAIAADHISTHSYQAWAWIAAGALVVIAAGWWLIHRFHKNETTNSLKGSK